MLFHTIVVFALHLAVGLSTPAPKLGLSLNKRADLPTLTLPYGTWRASKYDPVADIYTFKNIRFAAPPVGNLRWARPAPPQPTQGIQDGSFGYQCIQAIPLSFTLARNPVNGPGGAIINTLLSGAEGAIGNEDCLFLDMQVPGKAVRNPSASKLPVISWFYGGAYAIGAKNQGFGFVPFYDGTGPMKQSGNDFIFVSSNYRLGALGWLAGSTMESDGLPNAGLYDQRAALQWIQDYIYLLGGDKTKVSAWGESAGAGSILHHLVSFGGTQDPLFSKAVLQSPAFELLFDRKGKLEEVFRTFEDSAGCAGQGLACLRAASSASLTSANQYTINTAEEGFINIGPAVDGKLLRQLPALEFASGNYWKNLESLIISHTANEAALFVDGHIATNAQFNQYLANTNPAYAAPLNQAIQSFYPAVPSSKYLTQRARFTDFLRDSAFACNARYLTDAFAGKTWNMQYSVFPGLHATDLIPTFFDIGISLNIFGAALGVSLNPTFGGLATGYQSYLTSHATRGDPNTDRASGVFTVPSTINWPKPDNSGELVGNVLNVGDLGFSLISDTQTPKMNCDFWLNVQAGYISLGGYAPPGSVVASNLVATPANASVNY